MQNVLSFANTEAANEKRAIFMYANSYDSVIAVPMKLIVSVLSYVECEKCPSKLVNTFKTKLLYKLHLWALSILIIQDSWFGFFGPTLLAKHKS